MPSSKGRITHIRRGGKAQVWFKQVQKPTTTLHWVKLDLTLENNPYCMFVPSFSVHQKWMKVTLICPLNVHLCFTFGLNGSEMYCTYCNLKIIVKQTMNTYLIYKCVCSNHFSFRRKKKLFIASLYCRQLSVGIKMKNNYKEVLPSTSHLEGNHWFFIYRDNSGG